MDVGMDLDMDLEIDLDLDLDMDMDMENMSEVSISKPPSYSLSSFSSQQFMSHYPTVAAPVLPIRTPTVAKRVSSNQASLTTSSSSLSSTASFAKSYKTRNLRTLFSPTNLLILLTIFSSFLVTTCSAEFYIEERMVEVREDIPELFASTLARLARSGTILVDQRPDPSLPRNSLPELKTWEIKLSTSSDEGELDKEEQEKAIRVPIHPQSSILDLESDLNEKRDVATITSTATITPPRSTGTATATESSSSSSTLAESQTSSGLVSAATGATATLPTPFDSGFSSNITSTCSSFMMNFLANETFKACLPFSLLLQVCDFYFRQRVWCETKGKALRN